MRSLYLNLILLSVLSFFSLKGMKIENPSIDPSGFIFVQRGTLPIILTCPHGGKLPIPNVSERIHGAKSRDLYTHELAMEISAQLSNLTGKLPYIVASLFSRKFIDANRSLQDALEDDRAELIYHHYHESIKRFIDEIKKNKGQHLLLDIHGQGLDDSCIFRGTKNKKTVAALYAKHGKDALIGPNSMLGSLALNGYKIIPASEEFEQEEHPSFDGGFTVRKYGSHQENGIDAIQLEFGWDFRKPENRSSAAQALAHAIMVFINNYA